MRTMDKLKAFRPGKAQKAKLYGELEDGSLLRACIAGDEQAMAAFVSRFQKHIHTVVGRTIRKYTNDVDPTVIDDLTQEVFVSLFENERRRLRTYEGRDGAPLKAWLRVIAMRNTISSMRRWKKHSQLPNDETNRGSTHLVDEGPTATQMLAAQDNLTLKSKVLALAAKLPEEDRQLIEMIYVYEMSVPEITKALNIRRGALYMRKNRALVRLRDSSKAEGLM